MSLYSLSVLLAGLKTWCVLTGITTCSSNCQLYHLSKSAIVEWGAFKHLTHFVKTASCRWRACVTAWWILHECCVNWYLRTQDAIKHEWPISYSSCKQSTVKYATEQVLFIASKGTIGHRGGIFQWLLWLFDNVFLNRKTQNPLLQCWSVLGGCLDGQISKKPELSDSIHLRMER